MSKYAINDTTLTAIADSIRAKGGTSDPIQVSNFASAIANLPTGGGLPPEALVITGDCSYRFAYSGWDWFIENYGDKIITDEISDCSYMFTSNGLIEVPFELNIKQDISKFYYMFGFCQNLTSPPRFKLNLIDPKYGNVDFSYIFTYCNKIRDLDNIFIAEELENLSHIKVTSSYSTPKYNSIFNGCYSLRAVPEWFYKLRVSEESTVYPNYLYTIYYTTFQDNYVLDEITNLPVVRVNSNQTTNMFSNTFTRCLRLKNMTFETDNGTPYIVNWKSQTIDLSTYTGWSNSNFYITGYNSGITEEKRVIDDATYQALKNDPDWYSTNSSYSRYNHDSAVATINSLPDTSAYLATAGGTNTIKFKGNSGSATDGGAINTLTEEEIAVATAKGWTVSLV